MIDFLNIPSDIMRMQDGTTGNSTGPRSGLQDLKPSSLEVVASNHDHDP